jgi:hypothetical protein
MTYITPAGEYVRRRFPTAASAVRTTSKLHRYMSAWCGAGTGSGRIPVTGTVQSNPVRHSESLSRIPL